MGQCFAPSDKAVAQTSYSRGRVGDRGDCAGRGPRAKVGLFEAHVQLHKNRDPSVTPVHIIHVDRRRARGVPAQQEHDPHLQHSELFTNLDSTTRDLSLLVQRAQSTPKTQ